MMHSWCKTIALVVTILASANAQAGMIAVFGDNGLDDYINAFTPHTGVLVSDAQLQGGGFLDGFDAFVYTRNQASGTPNPLMSAGAAANVSSFVDRNIVLFNGDFSDSVGGLFAADADAQALFSNSLDFVVGSGGGYIGELFGFAAAFQSNAVGVPALGLVAGNVPGGFTGDDGLVNVTAAGLAHPVTAGVTFPFNPAEWDLSMPVNGYDPAAVLAIHPSERPAILAFGARVPEPGTLLLFGFGLAGICFRRRCRVPRGVAE